jgi:hypothetical protein
MARKPVTPSTETEVLLRSRRRCAIRFGLHRNTAVKSGQIAHLNQDNTNAKFENLVFLCLEHHDEYDGKTRQSKGLTKGEVKRFRDELYAFVATEPQLAWPDYPAMKDKLKAPKRPSLSLEVYDRKMQVYRIVREFFSVVFTYASVNIEQLQQFARDTDEAIFLFDRELADYIREIYKKAVSLHYTHERRMDQRLPVGEARSQLAEEDGKLLTWFSEQYEIARELFYKHIALG